MLKKTKKQIHNEIMETEKQVGKFSLVGVLNTILDMILYNLLIVTFALAPHVATVFSAGIAMVNSFYWNKKRTFKDNRKTNIGQMLRFILATIVGVFIIQTFVVYFLTKIWLYPGNLAITMVDIIGLSKNSAASGWLNFPLFSGDFVFNNFAKCWGVGFGMVWNFVLYKKWVFEK